MLLLKFSGLALKALCSGGRLASFLGSLCESAMLGSSVYIQWQDTGLSM